MKNAIDPGTACRKARAEPLRVRTTPPGLWLVAGGPTSVDVPLAGADLIALARAARRTAANGRIGEPAEPAQGNARTVLEG